MIKAIQELPGMKLGDIVDIAGHQYVVTGILSIFKDNDPDLEPTINFKVITEKLSSESMDN